MINPISINYKIPNQNFVKKKIVTIKKYEEKVINKRIYRVKGINTNKNRIVIIF